MNAQPEGQAAQAARGLGRGRGGRGRGGRNGNTSRGTIAANAAKSKVGPTRLLETEWVKDNLLKEDCFVIFVGTGKAGDQQWTVHRPVGEHGLPDGSWVMTPSRDLSLLLGRRESEELGAWKRQAELAKRQEVLRSRTGRRLEDQTEVWNFDGAPAIAPTIRTCMAAARAANAQESAWLAYADNAVQVAERSFKEALRTQCIPPTWLRANPKPAHKTMGGPLGDQPQVAVPYLEGLGINAAKDKVLRVALGLEGKGPQPEIDNTVDESESSDDEEDKVVPTTSPAGSPPKGAEKPLKKPAKK